MHKCIKDIQKCVPAPWRLSYSFPVSCWSPRSSLRGAYRRSGTFFAGPPQCKLAPRDDAFYQGLRDLGRIPGQNITVDLRCFSTSEEMRNVLREFVNRKVDVIFVGGPALALAARAATRRTAAYKLDGKTLTITSERGFDGKPVENPTTWKLTRID
jgi:hypothetical protein